MTGLEALPSVQFVTREGKRLAVLSAEDWEAMIEWLENVEERSVCKSPRVLSLNYKQQEAIAPKQVG
ncbi:MAG: hypothetical protein AB4352_25925 [Hormoscilla sp.]